MAHAPKVTVAICTLNRPEMLRLCLASLSEQSASQDHFEVLVVDNGPHEATHSVANSFKAGYAVAEQLGLSHARNTALSLTKTDWVFYLDDDAVASPYLLQSFLTRVSRSPEVVAIGGRYDHLLPEHAPKWLGHHYRGGHRPSPSKAFTELSPEQWLSGGIMAFRTALLKEVGGFNTTLGMKGTLIAYGEDDAIQDELRGRGHTIHYDPELVMGHHVQAHKHSISSQWRMAYAHGLSAGQLATGGFGLGSLAKAWLRTTFITVPYDLARVVFKKNFYWQNGLVTTGTKYAHALGKYRGASLPVSGPGTNT